MAGEQRGRLSSNDRASVAEPLKHIQESIHDAGEAAGHGPVGVPGACGRQFFSLGGCRVYPGSTSQPNDTLIDLERAVHTTRTASTCT